MATVVVIGIVISTALARHAAQRLAAVAALVVVGAALAEHGPARVAAEQHVEPVALIVFLFRLVQLQHHPQAPLETAQCGLGWYTPCARPGRCAVERWRWCWKQC